MIQRGTPTFDRKPVVVTPWHEDMDFKVEVHKIYIWVQFPFLPLKYWGPENLCRLASQLGVPVDIDGLTIQKNRGQFSRVQVLMEIKEEALEFVKYLDEHGQLCDQEVYYEWLPVLCKNCKGYGHRGKDFRKPKPQVWVPKAVNPVTGQDSEWWQQVTRKKDKGKENMPKVHRVYESRELRQNGAGSSSETGVVAKGTATRQDVVLSGSGMQQREVKKLVDKGSTIST